MKEELHRSSLVPEKKILQRIHLIRHKKVMLDKDLAELYGVETKALKQQVKRNLERFPEDFMFILNKEEFNLLRSQIVTSNWGGTRYLPMVFTEQGVAMLSSVLKSDRAIQINIQIMRIFTRIHQAALSNGSLKIEIEALKEKLNGHDKSIKLVFKYLDRLINKPDTRRSKIGFKRNDET